MKFTSTSKALPETTGHYTVKYCSSKSSKERVGEAKYVKSKKKFVSVKGASGKYLWEDDTFLFRSDNGQYDSRPSSRPRVTAWAQTA